MEKDAGQDKLVYVLLAEHEKKLREEEKKKVERMANGWEDKNGNKYPNEEPKDKFSQRMIAFFLFRPLLGILAGLLVFFGMQTGYFIETGIKNQSKVIFWSLLAGLFVKTLIEKLKSLFDSLVGKK